MKNKVKECVVTVAIGSCLGVLLTFLVADHTRKSFNKNVTCDEQVREKAYFMDELLGEVAYCRFKKQ